MSHRIHLDRAVGRVLVAGVLAAGVTGLAASPAAADCVTDDLARLAPEAQVVLVGTVTSVEAERGLGGTARLRVSDVWRGAPGSVVTVDGGPVDASTSVEWEAGRQYLVLAGAGRTLTTDACAGSRPVDDASLAALDAALGPATPLGRGAAPEPGAEADPETATPSASASSGAGEPSSEDAAAADGDSGLSTPELAAGILLGLAVLASFLLPQLRRHHRERRRERQEGTDPVQDPPEPVDPSRSWR